MLIMNSSSKQSPTTNLHGKKDTGKADSDPMSFYNKLMRRRSSAGSGLRPRPAPSRPFIDDSAPMLPPRNYKVDSDDNPPAQSIERAVSDVGDIAKPYQNVFNGGSPPVRIGNDDKFDADYTEKLRRLSTHQFVKSSAHLTKPTPSWHQPSSLSSPQGHLSPTNSSLSQTTPTSSTSPPRKPTHLAVNTTNNSRNVLETDMDASPVDIQPVPPPRRIVNEETPVPPPKLPKPRQNLPHVSREINHNEYIEPKSDNKPVQEPEARFSKPEPVPVPEVQIKIGEPKIETRILIEPKAKGVEHKIETRYVSETQSKFSEPAVERKFLPEPQAKAKEPKIDGQFVSEPQTKTMDSKIETHFVSEPQSKVTTIAKTETQHTPDQQTKVSDQIKHSESRMEQYKQSRLFHNKVSLPDSDTAESDLKFSKKERRSNSTASSQRSPSEDLTITSGDPTSYIARRQSFGKKSRASSRSTGHAKDDSISKEDTTSHKEDSPSDSPKMSTNAEINALPVPSDRNNRSIKPAPFNRYHDQNETSGNADNPISHSRQASAELLDIVAQVELNKPESIRKSPIPARRRSESRPSPTPPPRTFEPSPHVSRSSCGSSSSPFESRKSTPSPSSTDSKVGKSVPSAFVPISTEILAELSVQGIDINKKTECISDESKVRLVKLTAMSSGSSQPKSKAPSIKHIRQKSSDELLCDHQVEHIGKSIKDVSVAQVISKPTKCPTDYLPGLFDDVIAKDVRRKPRAIIESIAIYDSSINSDGDFKLSSDMDKKAELIQVLKRKLSVLKSDQEYLQKEEEDNEDSGSRVCKYVEQKCTEREVSKYKSYIDDIEKITKLLLKLSRRLARAENELRNAPMDSTDDDKKSLEQKRNNLQQQHDDARALKESVDKRKVQVLSFLERHLDSKEFEEYDNFISVKLKLIMEASDLDDQIMHCEEQLTAVHAISS